MTSGSLWNYCRDELSDNANENNPASYKINNNKTTASRSFEYTTKTIASTPTNNNRLDEEVVALLKPLSNSWRCFNLLSINCEIVLDLRMSKNCAISEISRYHLKWAEIIQWKQH